MSRNRKYKYDDDENLEYIDTVKVITVDGKKITVTNSHPILPPEEKERRHQEFLRAAAKIMEKYEDKINV